MRRLAFFILFSTFSTAMAQKLSIEDLWRNGTFEKVRQAESSAGLAELNVKAEKLGRLPLIYGEGELQRNLIIPSTPVPAIAFDPNASPGEIIPLKFATNWSATAGLQFSADLFNPQTKLALKTAEIERKQALVDYEQEVLNNKKNATSAYAQVVLASKQYQEALRDSSAYAEIVSVLNERFRAGRVPETELNRARQELINKRTLLSEAWRVLVTANSELSAYINTTQYTTLSSPIDSIVSKLVRARRDFESERLELERQRAEAQLLNLRLEALPTLSLNAFYGSQYFNNDLNLLKKERWYGNSYVSLGLRLPISEAIDRSLKKKQFTMERQIAESKLREQARLGSAQTQQQDAAVVHSLTVLRNAREIESLSARNAELLEQRYKAGKILITELNEELSILFKNKQNVWQAEYDYLTAILETL